MSDHKDLSPQHNWSADSKEILALRGQRRRREVIFALIILLLVIWSVHVTIVADTDWDRMGSASDLWQSASRFLTVDWSLFPGLVGPAIESVMIASLGSLLGVLISIPAIWFGALNITPYAPITYPLARFFMTVSRSIHEVVWALLFVAAVGLGALAGVLALATRSIGFIAKMSAEAIEDINYGQVEAIRATGANGFQVLLYAILPQVLPQILSVIIFEWEINLRRSAVLGLVGAGGLGLVIFRQMNTFNFPGVTSVIIVILGIVLVGEIISLKIRKALI